MKTCTLQEQIVKPDVQVGVAEIYRAVETSYDAVICVATQRFFPPPPSPLQRVKPIIRTLKTTTATMKTLLQKCIRVLFKLNRFY